MKIRIKGNSLRYRLTKSDVERFNKEGYLQEITDFGTATLKYALQNIDGNELSADFVNNTITVYMPQIMIAEWANTDRVGFENKKDAFYILVEKDFVCLDNVAEDQSDNYPNPLAGKC